MLNKKTQSQIKYEIPKAVQKELTDLLGEKNVCFTRELLSVYRAMAWGPWIRETVNPHGMVQPQTVEEVQAIMKIANKYKIPILLSGTSGPGFTWKGGLVIDTYSRMRKIHKIDPDAGYIVVEPGVSNGQILKAIRPYGCWISYGSYPPDISSLVSLLLSQAQTNVISKEEDFCLGVEAVLPTGEIIRTGTAATGIDYWSKNRGVMDLKFLYEGNMAGSMGVVTKAALRIHPIGEAQDIVIAGFNDFGNAINWTHKVAREVMANTSMIWSYRWVQWQNYAHEAGKGFITYLNDILKHEPDEVPPGYYSQYAFASISGYEEQVEGNVKACKRLAKELGGEIINKKFQEQWPGTWHKWEEMYVNHVNPGMAARCSHVYGIESSEGSFIVTTTVRDSKKFHDAVMKRFYEKYGIRHVRYYTRQMDHGRVTFQRYVYMHDKFDDKILDREIFIARDLGNWVTSEEFRKEHKNIAPMIAHTVEIPDQNDPNEAKKSKLNYDSSWLIEKIRQTVDPNNIMDPAFREILDH
jgi:FAD/FMN-containing dehydrogenase